MNWSTRLRRWVRIRTPPVRLASMKPTAATVLPAPVACSNQKRRSAPGSSATSSTTSSSRRRRAPPNPAAPRRRRAPRARAARALLLFLGLFLGRRRRLRSSSSSSIVLVVLASSSSSCRSSSSESASSAAPLSPRARVPVPRALSSARRRTAARRVAVAVGAGLAVGLELGDERRQGSREGVDLVLGELGAVSRCGDVLGEQALEAEHQRVLAAPLGGGRLGARVELGQGRVGGAAARRAGGEHAQLLALEQDRLSRELADSLEIGVCERRLRRAVRQHQWFWPWQGVEWLDADDPNRRRGAQ